MSPKKSNDEILQLKHTREVIIERLHRFKSYLSTGKNKDNAIQVEIRLKSVQEDFIEFDRVQTSLEFCDSNEKNERLNVEDEFYDVIGFAKSCLETANNAKAASMAVPQSLSSAGATTRSSSSSAVTTGAVAKLPTIGLPSFSGTYEAWLSFIDIFNSVVHSQSDLSDVDKFLYLKGCCKDDALRLIDSLEVTASNYQTALDLLKNRYENKRAIVNNHVNSILFKLPDVQKESSTNLRKLLDLLHQHLTALKNLDLPTDNWDALLIPIVLNKLDQRTRRDWEIKQDDNNLPTLNQLIEFLTKKCFSLEALQYDSIKSQKMSSENHNFRNSGTRNQQLSQFRQNKSSPQCFAVTETFACPVCNQSHFIYQCTDFTKLTSNDKYNVIRQHKLCSNCLRAGHFKNECNSGSCRKCSQKHNTLLHIDKPQTDISNSNGNRNSINNGNTASRPTAALVAREIYEFKRDPSFQSQVDRDQLHKATTAATRTTIGQRNVTAGNSGITPRPMMQQTGRSNDLDLAPNDQILHENISVSSHLSNISELSCVNVNFNQVLLSTAVVLIEDKFGNSHECVTLLDSGSQSNLMTRELRHKLMLDCEEIRAPLAGINQVVMNVHEKTKARIKSRFSSFQSDLIFLVLPVITEKLPLVGFSKNVMSIPKNIPLADENFNIPKKIDLLLGASVFYELIENGKIQLGQNMPVLRQTCLGWIFTGTMNLGRNQAQKSVCNFNSQILNNDLNEKLSRFWQIEELPQKQILSRESQFCENYFQDTTTRNSDGRFVVRLPFSDNINGVLGNSKYMALRRFQKLESRFHHNQVFKEHYIQFLQEYEQLNHMSFKCNLDSDISKDDESFFLPHTAVLRDSVTTKCRVVFDASAKSDNGNSLNDLLLVGPTIQDDLYSILLRLRLRKFVLSADVKMMFRQIMVHSKDRQFQQILWRYHPQDPVRVYTLNTVTYGTSCAPFLATRCLKQLALENKEKFPRTCKIIESSFYMDDLLVSVDSKNEALDIYHELTDILLQAGFELRKWSSNDISILEFISRSSNLQDEYLILIHEKKEFKTLGISWNPDEDYLNYSININLNCTKVTKRIILSTIAQIFDPLGLVSVCLIKPKILLQQIWKLKLDWDDEVPSELKDPWLKFVKQLPLLNEIRIPRQVLTNSQNIVSLFGFSDASEKAYGACVYLGSTDESGNIEIKLLTAKSKVCPIKKPTIPRIELLAAHLLAKLVNVVKDTLDINISETVLFTDSTIVLAWLKIDPSQLKTFVANRVIKITELTNLNDWHYVKSENNPADIISRGIDAKDLLNCDIWWVGPSFLKENTYKNKNDIPNHVEAVPEIKKVSITLATTQNYDFSVLNRFSTLTKLQNVVGYICRFKNRTLRKIPNNSNFLTIDELTESLNTLLRLAQLQEFSKEIADLKMSKTVDKNSKLINLNPFLDSNNLIRVGGRLSNSQLNYDQKYPIILPYKNKFTELLLTHEHLKNFHAGTQNLLSIVRLKYWPINGKNAIKKVVRSCVRCFRIKPKTADFLMGDLPHSRVTPARVFSKCGIDYAGPILIKESALRKGRTVKAYICVFVCFAVRAVHIELVKDLTTESFLNALKRFISRRGRPTDIYSDNGLNFVGASNHFSELYELLHNKGHQNDVTAFLAKDQIRWHFIPAKSPHVGGLWEAAVKSIKFHLKRVVGNTILTSEEMNTLLVQIEGCLNSRPLTPLSLDINDLTPLTPAHFLIGDSLASIPQHDVLDQNPNRLSRYHHLQQMLQSFWSRWSREYLCQLQTRTKWLTKSPCCLQVGSLVVLLEDNLPPLRWSMARVTALHPGPDGVLRVVSVRLPSGAIVKRSLKKICVLPIDNSG